MAILPLIPAVMILLAAERLAGVSKSSRWWDKLPLIWSEDYCLEVGAAFSFAIWAIIIGLT